jgi:hypothetical protein
MFRISFIILAIIFSSCNKQPKKSKDLDTKSKNPEGKKCRVNKKFEFPPLKYLSEKEKMCEKDSDCIASHLIRGSCCTHVCRRNWISTKKFHKRAVKYREECCKGIKLNCKEHFCYSIPYRTSAKCENKECKIVKTPNKRNIKKKTQ